MLQRKSRVGTFALVAILLASGTFAQDQAPASLPAGPLTLAQVLELAAARSEAIGIARGGIERARADRLRVRSGLFPQLTASASYDRALASEFSNIFGGGGAEQPCAPFALNPGAALGERVAEIERAIDCGAVGNSFFGGGDDDAVDLPFGRENTWRVNLAFSQSVYSGGRIGAQADIAVAGLTAAEVALDTARAQLLFDATRAFYDVALSEQLVRIAEATLEQAEATVRQVQAGFEAGAQPEFEVLRARVTRDNQRPAVIRQKALRDVALLRLKQLLDLPPEFDLRVAPALDAPGGVAPPPLPESMKPAEGERVRGVVREATASVRLREASLRLAEAERRPSLAVSSTYTRVAYPSGLFPTGDLRTNWTLGANVQLPILTGGRLRAAEAVARAELDQSRLQLRQVEELAQLDERSAQAELAAAQAVFDASAGTVEQAQRAYQIAEVRFQSGVSTQLELSDARLLLQQAETNRAQAARDLHVARARMALLPDLPIGSSGGLTAPVPATSPTTSGGASLQGARGGVQ
jgi:outer membrane protein TolC